MRSSRGPDVILSCLIRGMGFVVQRRSGPALNILADRYGRVGRRDKAEDRDKEPLGELAHLRKLTKKMVSFAGPEQTTAGSYRYFEFCEALLFAGFVALYIWRLQATTPESWMAFPIWLVASFVLHGDTPKSMGWRADNLWPATRRAAPVFACFIAGVCVAGLFLGAVHRVPAHLISWRRFAGYFSFCLLQQVGLNSYLNNRLLSALKGRVTAAVVCGLIFAALHWPNPVLVPLTFVGGTAMAWLFSRERNILPLTLGQAILGGLVWWAFPLAWHHSMRVGPGYYTFTHKIW